ALHEDVGAEAREVLHAEAEIELLILLEAELLRVGEDRVAELLGVDRRERLGAQRDEIAVDAELRRRAGRDVEIAGGLVEHRFQDLMQGRRRHLSSPVLRWISPCVMTPSRFVESPAMPSYLVSPRISSALISSPDAPCSTRSFSASVNGISS